MLDKNGNTMTAEKLDNDGAVLLICAIFGLYDNYDRHDSRISDNSMYDDVMSRLFGGACKIGNAHNESYQLGLNMSRIALKRYTCKLTR